MTPPTVDKVSRVTVGAVDGNPVVLGDFMARRLLEVIHHLAFADAGKLVDEEGLRPISMLSKEEAVALVYIEEPVRSGQPCSCVTTHQPARECGVGMRQTLERPVGDYSPR